MLLFYMCALIKPMCVCVSVSEYTDTEQQWQVNTFECPETEKLFWCSFYRLKKRSNETAYTPVHSNDFKQRIIKVMNVKLKNAFENIGKEQNLLVERMVAVGNWNCT